MPKIYIIGICGPSCGGKTTTCNKIIEALSKQNKYINIIVISQDRYYKGGNEENNYDIPESIDWDLLNSHMIKIRNGEDFELPIYDFSTHTRKKETEKLQIIQPCIVIVEGILIFTNDILLKLIDLKVFVSSFDELRFMRRLDRDCNERGRNENEVKKRYLEHVIPSTKVYVEPTQYKSDILLFNNEHNKFIGLFVLLDHINKRINDILLEKNE
jgi:uridine kinase